MRHLAILLAACGGSEPNLGSDANPPPARGFQIISPDVMIAKGQEITLCYYFRTPNTEEMAIKAWSSVMTPGSHHMIFYTTSNDVMPPGTVSPTGCGGFSSTNIPSWTYAAQTPMADEQLPTDDGAGKPLAQKIAPNTPGYFQMHYLNLTDQDIQAHVTLDAIALDANAPYTPTSPYITYNSQISIPPGATNDVESMTCNVPAGIKFWSMSTHAHKQAIETQVLDGANAIFTSMDWEHPGAHTWDTSPFYTFASGKLTYQCTYNNTGTNSTTTVVSGPSAQTNEMCMAIGYYFPATKSLVCLNSSGPF